MKNVQPTRPSLFFSFALWIFLVISASPGLALSALPSLAHAQTARSQVAENSGSPTIYAGATPLSPAAHPITAFHLAAQPEEERFAPAEPLGALIPSLRAYLNTRPAKLRGAALRLAGTHLLRRTPLALPRVKARASESDPSAGPTRSQASVRSPESAAARRIAEDRAASRVSARALYAQSRLTEAKAARAAADARGFFAAPPALWPVGSRPQEKLWRAVHHYYATGEARVVQDGLTKVFPYGKKQPTILTSILRFTLLELAPNEYVVDYFIGDAGRWKVDVGAAGGEGNFTQIVSVKPEACSIRTNLALTTSEGRVYQMELFSADCDLESDRLPDPDAYTRHVRWYYPDGSVRRSREETISGANRGVRTRLPAPDFSEDEKTVRDRGEEAGEDDDLLSLIDLREANTNYDIDIDRRFPCAPSMVADDGTRMYIRFPKEQPLCKQRFPLFAQGEGRNLQLVNYEVFDGHIFVVEGTPIETVLMYRTERGRERRVEITNEMLKAALNRRR